jgi:hypothetical protein
MPTPHIDSTSSQGAWITQIESSPTLPQSSAVACTVLRLVTAAKRGNANATMKHTIE